MSYTLSQINDTLIKYVPDYEESNDMNDRKKLYTLLTLLNCDIPQDLCHAIETILYRERKACIGINDIIRNYSLPDVKVGNGSIWIYKGDITTLSVDAIVNAANDEMLGCFNPSHKCIDNVIHAHSGPRLRMECRKIKQQKGKLGQYARITNAYCLPSRHVIHVAGPIYDANDKSLLADKLSLCYRSSSGLILAFG